MTKAIRYWQTGVLALLLTTALRAQDRPADTVLKETATTRGVACVPRCGDGALALDLRAGRSALEAPMRSPAHLARAARE